MVKMLKIKKEPYVELTVAYENLENSQCGPRACIPSIPLRYSPGILFLGCQHFRFVRIIPFFNVFIPLHCFRAQNPIFLNLENFFHWLMHQYYWVHCPFATVNAVRVFICLSCMRNTAYAVINFLANGWPWDLGFSKSQTERKLLGNIGHLNGL